MLADPDPEENQRSLGETKPLGPLVATVEGVREGGAAARLPEAQAEAAQSRARPERATASAEAILAVVCYSVFERGT